MRPHFSHLYSAGAASLDSGVGLLFEITMELCFRECRSESPVFTCVPFWLFRYFTVEC